MTRCTSELERLRVMYKGHWTCRRHMNPRQYLPYDNLHTERGTGQNRATLFLIPCGPSIHPKASNSLHVFKMKYTPVFLFGFAATGAARAKEFANVPPCALNCVDALIAEYTPCSDDDITCICSYQKTLHEHGFQCIIDSCGIEKATGEYF